MPIRIPLNVEFRLAELVREHPDWGAKRYAEALQAEFPDTAPSERTVSTRLAKLRDTSGKWTLGPGERDAGFLLDVLATMPGPLPTLTRDEAIWLGAVHAAAPHLTPAEALTVARLYLASAGMDDGHERSHQLDLALAKRSDITSLRQRWLGVEAETRTVAGGKVTVQKIGGE